MYLQHHGILGQKWGTQHGPPYPLDDNPRRQAQLKKDYARLGNKKLLQKAYDNRSNEPGKRWNLYGEINEWPEFKQIAKDQRITTAINNFKTANAVTHDFFHDEKVRDKYRRKAAEKHLEVINEKEKGKEPDSRLKNVTAEDIFWDYKYGDGDQGPYNALQMYLADKGINPYDHEKKMFPLYEDYIDAIETVGSEILGAVGNRTIKNRAGKKTAVSDMLRDIVDEICDSSSEIFETFDMCYTTPDEREYFETQIKNRR